MSLHRLATVVMHQRSRDIFFGVAVALDSRHLAQLGREAPSRHRFSTWSIEVGSSVKGGVTFLSCSLPSSVMELIIFSSLDDETRAYKRAHLATGFLEKRTRRLIAHDTIATKQHQHDCKPLSSLPVFTSDVEYCWGQTDI